ncbi:hypothetical protein LTR74_012158 [Friedmanniomyces endolithicus]|nr:hypothetical protein LTR74_012158 [Friedmanniomyces endolithicus]
MNNYNYVRYNNMNCDNMNNNGNHNAMNHNTTNHNNMSYYDLDKKNMNHNSTNHNNMSHHDMDARIGNINNMNRNDLNNNTTDYLAARYAPADPSTQPPPGYDVPDSGASQVMAHNLHRVAAAHILYEGNRKNESGDQASPNVLSGIFQRHHHLHGKAKREEGKEEEKETHPSLFSIFSPANLRMPKKDESVIR